MIESTFWQVRRSPDLEQGLWNLIETYPIYTGCIKHKYKYKTNYSNANVLVFYESLKRFYENCFNNYLQEYLRGFGLTHD